LEAKNGGVVKSRHNLHTAVEVPKFKATLSDHYEAVKLQCSFFRFIER
jgi:hypothetical protein